MRNAKRKRCMKKSTKKKIVLNNEDDKIWTGERSKKELLNRQMARELL